MNRTLILCAILAIIVFGIQLFLCLKTQKNKVKYIPVYCIIALHAVALLLCIVNVFLGGDGVAIWLMAAVIIFLASFVALVADIIAWVVYKQIQKRQA